MHHVITGGAGFIGSHLADALVAGGDAVTIVDDLSTGSLANVEHLLGEPSVRFLEASVTDAVALDDALVGADTCFHLASAVGVHLIVDHPLESMQRNVAGMQNVVELAHRRCARLVLASTSEIYGKGGTELLHEDSDRVLGAPTRARWTYANAKAYGEMLAYGYHAEYGAENIVVRFFNAVGPRQTGQYGMVVPSFVRQALRGEDITVFGDGTQSRCFTHVGDTVEALLQLVRCDGALGRPFNVGCGREISIEGLAEEVLRRTGSGSRIRHVPYEQAYGDGFEELGSRRPDTTALERLTGWRARRTVEEAIDEIVVHDRAMDAATAIVA